jgi:hypothetical protein
MRASKSILFALGCLLLLPAGAFAQASITGVVRDSSGAVLPGVTVEATSPALIEKSRSVVTDGSGQYRIVDLRPGTYDVTFSLAGFNGVKREGIELTGSFTATVNPGNERGSVAETITVKGETPIVDVRATRQAVMGRGGHGCDSGWPKLIRALVVLIPGMTAGADVGGTNNLRLTANLAIHGGRAWRRATWKTASRFETSARRAPSPTCSQTKARRRSGDRLCVGHVGDDDERREGQYIPKEGGNSFKGSFFGTFVNDKFQGDNFTQD